jgi:hypothetical protein
MSAVVIKHDHVNVAANGGTGVLRCFLSVPVCDPASFWYVNKERVQTMLKCLLLFFSGAVTITGFVVATGAHTGGLVALGFAIATIFYGLLAFIIGTGRIVRFLLWITGKQEHHRPRRTPFKRAVAERSDVEQDVISALVQQGARRSAAAKATADAILQSPQEFGPLFRTAVGLLRSR